MQLQEEEAAFVYKYCYAHNLIIIILFTLFLIKICDHAVLDRYCNVTVWTKCLCATLAMSDREKRAGLGKGLTGIDTGLLGSNRAP